MRLLLVFLLCAGSLGARSIVVLAWSERSEPVEVYPAGINGAVAAILSSDKSLEVRTANLLDPEQGLSEAALADVDVLVWFGHRNHAEVRDEAVERVVRRVTEEGMGFLPLHSAHYARPFVELMKRRAAASDVVLEGRIGRWGRVRNDGRPETIRVVASNHPIAKGVQNFVIPWTEMYANPFNVPPADVKVFSGSWENGEQDGSDGLVWTVGQGRVFYFRPGHETRPILERAEVQQILRNAVGWLAP